MRLLAAMVGNRVAVSCPAPAPRESSAMSALDQALTHSGLLDKELAPAGVTAPTFSKMRAGTQAFPIALLDALPGRVRVDFCRRLLEPDGYDVRRRDPGDIAEELLASVEHVGKLARLYRQMVKSKPAKAQTREEGV